jgi:hypothetical protein
MKLLKGKMKAVIAVWVVALMMMISTIAYAAWNSIGVELVNQAKSNWCWAASLEMSATYLGYDDYDQWDIVKECKGTSSEPYPNEQGNASDYSKGMKYATGNDYTATRSSGTISLSSLNGYMNNSVPVIIAIGTYNSSGQRSGHAVVVFSVDTASNQFKVKDPGRDSDVTYNYDTITDTSQTRRWDATVKISQL